MSGLDEFAAEAVRFRDWASNPGEGLQAAREALQRLSLIYAAGLKLPRAWHPDLPEVHPQGFPDDEWESVLNAMTALPLRFYCEVFDPLAEPPEEPVAGDIADDIADIYRDVVRGLRLYEAGKQLEARWEWGFNFVNHWGEHATGAMRALHQYLAQNDPSGDSAPSD